MQLTGKLAEFGLETESYKTLHIALDMNNPIHSGIYDEAQQHKDQNIKDDRCFISPADVLDVDLADFYEGIIPSTEYKPFFYFYELCKQAHLQGYWEVVLYKKV